jgi:hypothetical protein
VVIDGLYDLVYLSDLKFIGVVVKLHDRELEFVQLLLDVLHLVIYELLAGGLL